MYAVTILLLAAALAAVLRYRAITLRTMKTLDKMLDSAIRGDFAQERFDESRLSAVEAKLSKYLSSSAVSARNLTEEKEKIKQLIADISHQTKTPIANLLLYAQLLEEQELTEESRSCVAALEGQAKKLESLIQAMVKTSRLETGVLAMHTESSPLSPILESAVEQLTPRAAEKDIRLVLESTAGSAVCDRKWTEEALCNLVDNAVKYTPAGGCVTVSAREFELFSCISVADTGPGIAEAEQAKIFQRFYRGSANYNAEGVGIGLYLVRQIAQSQGGYVKVSSPRCGGAEFSLYLPRS
ncbi:MAG: sensor histidine kinase [Candidatus Heteroscillospira sp.]|jgi:signal transduction histidine kinase